ncbi:MAG TPA: hypothetical protein VIM02_06910 [Rhizomicrobium sp.]|jgi:cell division protein FtsN
MSDLRGMNAPKDVQMGNTGKIAGAIAIAVGLTAIGAYTYATSANHQQTVKVAANDIPAPVTPPAPSVTKPSTTPPDTTAPVLDTQTPSTPKTAAAPVKAVAPAPKTEMAQPVATHKAASSHVLQTEPVVERRTVKPVTPPTLPTQSAAPEVSAPAPQSESAAPAQTEPAAQPAPEQAPTDQPTPH